MLALLLTLLLPFYSFGGRAIKPSLAPQQAILNHILIVGNEKTKESIILRELDVERGDTLDLTRSDEVLLKNRNKIFNTNLFNTVELSFQNVDPHHVVLMISVTERWYVFPMLIFELADRNFNEWWYERNRDLSRTQYGLRLEHKNFRGRREEVRGTAQFGFTKRFDLAYSVPYIDRAKRHGIGFEISYAQNKSVAYQARDNKLEFLDSEQQLRERFRTGVRLTRRDGFYIFHSLEAQYNHNKIADTIASLNPHYFLNGRTNQQYFSLTYDFAIDRRDIVAYPLHGHYFGLTFFRAGFTPKEDLHQTSLTASYSIYRDLGKKFYWTANLQGKTSYPALQPYYNVRGLGYNQSLVRGYEYYVVDGQNFALAKVTFKRELFNIQKAFPSLIPLPQFQTIPIALYFKIYGDAGYASDITGAAEQNPLANRMLYGGGVGFDLVTFYNSVFRVDYSINRSLERGIFIHFRRDI